MSAALARSSGGTDPATNGSWWITCMPKARPSSAMRPPMAPSPIIPSVEPRNSVPRGFGQPPVRMVRSITPRCRVTIRISPNATSATASAKAPGEFSTGTPRSVAAARSMLSVPVPHLAMTRNLGSAAVSTARLIRSSPASQPSMSPTRPLHCASSMNCATSGQTGSYPMSRRAASKRGRSFSIMMFETSTRGGVDMGIRAFCGIRGWGTGSSSAAGGQSR